MNYFYTITRKIGFTTSSAATTTKINSADKTYRVFCEYHAYKLPENVTAYYVSTTSTDNSTNDKTATLEKLNTNYVPARTPVILASSDESTDSKVMDVYVDNPEIELTAALSSSSAVTNLLQPVYTTTTIKPTETDANNVTYDNYLLSEEDVKGTTTLAFYRPVSTGVTLNRNTCYLRVPRSASGGAKMFRITMFSNTTGINKVVSNDEPEVWHNLQGVRISRPTTKGIYILNHHKVVLR